MDEEPRFISLVNRRNEIHDVLSVLAKLQEEKSVEQKMIDDAFLKAFGIDPNKFYRFDRASRALHLLPSPPQNAGAAASGGNSPVADKGEFHKSLTEKQTQVFLRFVEARQQIQVAVQGIAVLNSQKIKQWNKVRDELQQVFGIQRDLDYSYDKETRMIYRIGSKSTVPE